MTTTTEDGQPLGGVFSAADKVKLDGIEVGAQVNAPRITTLPFFKGNNPYLQETSNSYAVQARFIFPGSALVGVPTTIKAIFWRKNGTSCSMRIYDLDNALTIAEITGVTDTVKTVQDLGAIANIPAAEAMFEVQTLRVGTNGKARTSGITILY